MNRQIDNFRLISMGWHQKLDICSVYTDYIISIFSMINSVFIIKSDLRKKKPNVDIWRLPEDYPWWTFQLTKWKISIIRCISQNFIHSYWWLISVIFLLIQLLKIWFTKSIRNFWFTQLNKALIDLSALCIKTRGLYSIRLRQGTKCNT